MAYERGFLNKRLTIVKRATATVSTRGTDTGSVKYELLGTYFGNKTWNKGAKAMHEGAMDAYDTVMFRMDYRSTIDRWCLIKCEGKWYQIQSLNGDYHENQLQITAIEMPNQKVNIVEPKPEPTNEGTSSEGTSNVSDGSAVGNDENTETNVEQ